MKILSLGKPFANDDALVRAMQQGNPKAEAYLYKKYRTEVMRYLIKQGATEIQAEDLYQETMIIAMEKISDASFQLTAKISTFLISIAQKRWLNQLRKNRQNPTVSILTDEDNDEGKATGILEKFLATDNYDAETTMEEQFQILHKGLSQISEKCRQMLDTWYARTWGTSDELAAQFGTRDGETLKKAVHRCREKLRAIVIPMWQKQQM